MEVSHQTRTIINVDDRLYTISCTCGQKTHLELCGACSKRPAVETHLCSTCRKTPNA